MGRNLLLAFCCCAVVGLALIFWHTNTTWINPQDRILSPNTNGESASAKSSADETKSLERSSSEGGPEVSPTAPGPTSRAASPEESRINVSTPTLVSKTSSEEPAPSNTKLFKESCEEQWQQFTRFSRLGKDLVYTNSLASQSPPAKDIPASHTEVVAKSNSSTVVHDVVFTSDHPTAMLLTNSLGLGSQLPTSRHNFVNTCVQAGGKAVRSVLFPLVDVKSVKVRDVRIKVGAGDYSAYQMQFMGSMRI